MAHGKHDPLPYLRVSARCRLVESAISEDEGISSLATGPRDASVATTTSKGKRSFVSSPKPALYSSTMAFAQNLSGSRGSPKLKHIR